MPAGRRASRNAGRNDGWKSERRSLAKGSYSVDRRLAPRIRQYIEQFRHGYVPDVEEIADYLQNRYGEYSRKKRNAFRLSVQKVYQAICSKQDEERHLQNLEDKFLKKRRNSPDYSVVLEDKRNQFGDESNSTDEDSTDSDVVLVGDESLMSMDNNLLNQSMQKMYSRSSSSRPVSETEEPSHNLNSNIALAHPKDNKANSGEVLKNSSTSLTSRPSGVSTSVSQEKSEDYTKSLNERKLPLTEKRKRDPEEEITSSKEPGKKQKSLKKSRGNNGSKSQKNIEAAFSPILSTVKFCDIGGCDENIHNVCKLLVHMRHPEVFHTIRIAPPQGFLLHGPPGCGKTLFANAIAGELELPLIRIAATEIVSGVSGESEEKVRELFARAVSHSPCVLFIDEIDAITPKRETASKDMERRIVSQLLTCMDELNENKETRVLVIGATNRPDALDPALRRAGRFDREISMGIPDTKARERILKVMCKNLRVEEHFSFAALAQQTPGFVGADLMALTREAAMVAVNRIFRNLEEEKIKKVEENLVGADSKCEMQGSELKEVMDSTPTKDVGSDEEPVAAQHSFSIMRNWIKDGRPLEVHQLHRLFVEMDDFKVAFALVQPSAKREGFATIPDVTWDDIGALKDIRGELTMAILAPVRHPEEFSALGLTHPPGILLAGPPGCGKTLLAKAIANESGINFISVKGPELLNMYVGESEKAVRQVFQRARNSSPCVIFFDELDALCPRRSGSAESSVGVRVVNQLLTEMDGLEARKQVFIMGATNRPDIIDPAVLRPGRLDKVLYVGLPSESDREEILRTITKNGAKPRLQPDVDIKQLARDERCHGFSGADLAALVREAAVTALRDVIGTSMGQSVRMMDKKETWNKETVAVGLQHFEKAFRKVKPSVSTKDQVVYERIKEFAARL